MKLESVVCGVERSHFKIPFGLISQEQIEQWPGLLWHRHGPGDLGSYLGSEIVDFIDVHGGCKGPREGHSYMGVYASWAW